MEEIKKEEMTQAQLDTQRVNEIFENEANREKILAIKDADDAFAFFAENGIEFTDEQKKDIRAKAEIMHEKINNSELTEDELESVAGGWDFGTAFFTGLGAAAVTFCVITAFPAAPAWCAVAAVVGGGAGGFLG